MPTITFRTDSVIEQALAELMADGADRSTAIRDAILAARKAHRAHRLRQQSAAVAADPKDVEEMRAVMADMEDLSAW